MAAVEEIAAVIKKLGSADNLPKVPEVARAFFGKELSGAQLRGFAPQVYEAEPVAFPSLKLPATQTGVAQGRKAGLRFERVAARTGLPVREVRDMAEKVGLGADYYLGIGR